MSPSPPQARRFPRRGTNGGLPEAVVESFRRRYGRDPAVVVRAPGRVNLLGAHIDYSEGWVMPAAIDRAVWLAAAPAAENELRIHALDLDQTATLDLDALPVPVPQRADPATTWVDYPAGVAWALRDAGYRPAGMAATFGGDVPVGAGLSASAALEVAFLIAWERLSGFALDGLERARLGQRAENAYLDVQSGIMDQFASIHGKANHLILLDCRSLTYERIPLPAGTAVVVADTGVRRRLADSGFNSRRAQCQEAVAILRRELPEIQTLRDVAVADFERCCHQLPEPLRSRARHAVEECERVRAGAEALRRRDLDAFGELMRRSHVGSRDLYEVSIPELDTLAATAWGVAGCYGARLAGGGFGGCLIALAAESAVAALERALTLTFKAEFGRSPVIFPCSVSDGAGIVEG
ncbi:MAG: galactokinase [bacterium]|nr:galactokinase [bacterium]